MISVPFFRRYPQTVSRNFAFNLVDGALFGFAMSLISMVTVLPVFVRRMGGSNLLVGLIQVIWILGFNFPQIFVAKYARTLPYKKPWVLKTAFLQRVPWLILAVFCLFMVNITSETVALVTFFLCFSLGAITGSINLPGWFDLVAKITPVKIRGRLFALRTMFAAVLGVLGGWIVKLILERYEYPDNFALLFVLAFSVMMISYLFLVLLREEDPNPSGDNPDFYQYLKTLPGIISKQINFRNFLIADALLTIAIMANGFYVLQALSRMDLPDEYAGFFTIVLMTSLIVWNLIIGATGDRFGHKVNFSLATGAVFLASLTALFAQSLSFFIGVFIAFALTQSVIQVSRLAIIAELSGEQDRSTYVSLANMITSPFILTGLLGGWLADRLGYEVVFIISAVAALLSFIVWNSFVQEPRTGASGTVMLHRGDGT